MLKYPATLLCDFYKVSHKEQYPKGTEIIYSTWTPRTNKYAPDICKVTAFGFQYFIKEYLVKYFNEMFFNRDLKDVVDEYYRIIKYTLGLDEPDVTHIQDLWSLGYLPIKIKAVKEGTLIPLKTPMLTIENTDPRFFWLTNYLESLLSSELWLPSTSASIATHYYGIGSMYSDLTVGNRDHLPFQFHDFSFRGMEGLNGAAVSGAGHLLPFVGTDSIPSIVFHEKYYNANVEKELVGTSIPATEHSVMCANSDPDVRDEYDNYKRLITEIYPNGFVSIVSDTYDFWKVIGEILPQLKEEIMSRDGKVVIRPDSGDPVKIICGDLSADNEFARKGLIRCLWDIFGGTTNSLGYKVLDPHIGAIYGDSITPERAATILYKLMLKGFASNNIVFGIGSYTYQYNTRDTFGFAVKATAAQVNGVEKQLFKDPKTDDGTKRSQRGRVIVLKNPITGSIEYKDGLNKKEQEFYTNIDLLETIFENGKIIREESLSEIRKRLMSQFL